MESTGRFTPALRRLLDESYDLCRSCGRLLPKKTFAYAGYGDDGSPLYVGPCCQHLLQEYASPIYWHWERDKRCSPETVLWRYMDFAKFVALLEQQGIHFARADRLGDAFEGATGNASMRPQWDAYYLEYFRDSMRRPPAGYQPLSAEKIELEAHRLLGEMSEGWTKQRHETFVSCWHANAGESEALWRLYCPPPTAGVAIATTAQRLVDELGNAPFKLGRVYYIDMRTEFPGIHDRIFAKRKSLAHESEVRAVINKPAATELGLVVPVRLADTLLGVVPSPFAPDWFPGLVQALLARFGLTLPVVQSELVAEPFF